jgi:hypothetical protein
MDGSMTRWGAVIGSLVSFQLLLLFCIELLTDILWHVVMRPQLAPLRHMSYQSLQLMRP